MAIQTFTFKELDTIRLALLVAAKTDLPIDAPSTAKALIKIDGTLDKYCRTQQHYVFAFLPLLAENDEE